MCKPILTTAQMLYAENHTFAHDGVTSLDLQELAGKAVAQTVNRLKLDAGRFIIFTGKGNNASDGFVAARLLRQKNMQVTVISLFPENTLNQDCSLQAQRAQQAGVSIHYATTIDDIHVVESWTQRGVMIIDAIFGTGLMRPVAGWPAEAIARINQCDRPVLAIDIASGIQSDSGNIIGCAIKADFTLPVAAYKWGHWLRDGAEYSGKVLAPASIRISADTIERALRKVPGATADARLIDGPLIESAFPPRPSQSHKKTFGHLWVFGGSQGFTGAPQLCAMGAQAIGTGLVSIACPENVYPIIAASSLEVMVHPQQAATIGQADAIVAGPGWGQGQSASLIEIISSRSPLILDADALNCLANDKTVQHALEQRKGITILTPHPGEASRLLKNESSEIQEDRLTAAVALAETYRAWVVLKGAHTLVVSPLKHIWLNPFGSANLAVAGTGDVLAGMIGGLLATGVTTEIAIPAAVGLHGMVGEQDNWHRAGQLEALVARKAHTFRHK